MAEQRIAVGHQPGEEAVQIGLHIGVGVLLDQEAGGGVADEKGEEGGLDLLLVDPIGYLTGDFDQGAARRSDVEDRGGLVRHEGKNRAGARGGAGAERQQYSTFPCCQTLAHGRPRGPSDGKGRTLGTSQGSTERSVSGYVVEIAPGAEGDIADAFAGTQSVTR